MMQDVSFLTVMTCILAHLFVHAFALCLCSRIWITERPVVEQRNTCNRKPHHSRRNKSRSLFTGSRDESEDRGKECSSQCHRQEMGEHGEEKSTKQTAMRLPLMKQISFQSKDSRLEIQESASVCRTERVDELRGKRSLLVGAEERLVIINGKAFLKARIFL